MANNQLGVFWTVVPESVQFVPPPPPPSGEGGSGPPPIGSGEVIGNPDGNPDGPPGDGGGPILINPGTYKLRFSATVAFRLTRGDGSVSNTTLAAYPALKDWPSFLEGIGFGVQLSGFGDNQYDATLLNATRPDAWTRLFPESLVVKPQPPDSYDAREKKAIRSYPRREVTTSIRKLHAGSQVSAASDAIVIAPIPRSILTSSLAPLRTLRTTPALRSTVNSFISLQDGDPETWVITRADRNTKLASSLRPASDFAQLSRYYGRLLQVSEDYSPRPRPAFPQHDFHQLAALALLQPAVARSLGLILDFEAEVPAFPNNGDMRLTAEYTAPGLDRGDVFFRTAYELTSSGFEIPASEGGLYDGAGRYLRLGDSSVFDVEDGFDIDSAALKASDAEEQFDPNPVDSDLPALRTTGIGINRVDNSLRIATQRLRDRKRFNMAFGRTEDKKVTLKLSDRVEAPEFINHAEDLVRGFRFDVWDEATETWRSLHQRSGSYLVGPEGDAVELVLARQDGDEGFMSVVPSRPRRVSNAQAAPSDEYFVSETLMRWGGWSLSVPRVGAPITNDDRVLERNGVDPAFPRPDAPAGRVVTRMNRAHDLPRLRFGRTYRFRARVVDVAGNSLGLDDSTRPEDMGDTASAPVTFRRYDPVESPTLVYRDNPTPGEGVHELVVRSENATEFSGGISRRLIPPPPTSQWMAECHGKFDASLASDTRARNQYEQLLRNREGLSWEVLEESGKYVPITSGGFRIPEQPGGDRVPVPYLVDPVVERARIANLPGDVDGEEWVRFGAEGWPNLLAAKLVLRKDREVAGVGSFVPPANGDTIDVALTKGDVRVLRISSAMALESADLFGLFNWSMDEVQERFPDMDLTTFRSIARRRVAAGAHRAITPPQEVRLVHAVRKPLAPPNFELRGNADSPFAWRTFRNEGETVARVTGEIGYSPRSTGRLDVRATWVNVVDEGPGKADPTIGKPKGVAVFSRELDRNTVPAGLTVDHDATGVGYNEAVHEIGDTRHHRVKYFSKATSAFLPYFRQEVKVVLVSSDFGSLGATNISRAPVTVVGVTSKRAYIEGQHYTLNRTTGVLTRRRVAPVGPLINEAVIVSFIPGDIEWEAAPVERHVAATERPDPPVLHSVVPTFRWNRAMTPGAPGRPPKLNSHRSGGGLRIWLERPWWSSGEDEKLGIIVAPLEAIAPNGDSQDFLSMSGTDPISDSRNTSRFLRASQFSGGEAPVRVSLAENGRLMEVVPYPVQYDSGRDMWFADITVAPNLGSQVAGYFPFVRLALVRFQPYAVDHDAPAKHPASNTLTGDQQTLNVSSVVITDFIQVAPERDVYLDRANRTVAVRVVGESYVRLENEATLVAVPAGRGPTEMVVTLQRRDTAIADPELCWVTTPSVTATGRPRSAPVTLTPTQRPSDRYIFDWNGSIILPPAVGTRSPEYRLLVEEFETHYSDADGTQLGVLQGNGLGPQFQTLNQLPSAKRCVFQDTIPLTGL